MAAFLSLKHSADLTGEDSFNADQPQPIDRPSHLHRSARTQNEPDATSSQRKILWSHAVALVAIAAAGFVLVKVSSLAQDTGLIPAGRITHFLETSTMPLVGLGFAMYGCLVNRRLIQEKRRRELLGPYKLLKLIGSGGMGEVYLAEHELLKRRCAVKLIRSDKSSNRRMLERFEREVKATAQLTHWNTVQVYDYGCTTSGTFYYSMEYLQGLDLRQLVDQHGPLPAHRVVFIVRQLCGALHEAAMFGLVHRDIKPSNIFLTERGQMFDVAKLLDFGLVRPASFGSNAIRNLSHKLQGSPKFMCPEQAKGQKPDCRGDLYSLACVAYYLLSGRAPFEDENPVMLVVAHGSMPAPGFDEIGVSVPHDLASIVLRCLNKNPEDRFQSPRELQEALELCDCSGDWTAKDAEAWWLENRREIHHTQTEEKVDGQSQPSDTAPSHLRDVTLVCESGSADESEY